LPKIRSSKKESEKEIKGSVEWMISFEDEFDSEFETNCDFVWEYSFNVSQNHQLVRIDLKFIPSSTTTTKSNSTSNDQKSKPSMKLSILGRSKSGDDWTTIYESVDLSQYVFSMTESVLSLSIPIGFISLSQIQLKISKSDENQEEEEEEEEDDDDESQEGMESKPKKKKSKEIPNFNLSVELLQSSSKKPQSQVDLIQSDSTSISNNIVELCQSSENSLALRSCALNVLAVMILRDNQTTLDMLAENIDLQRFSCNFVDGDLVTSNVASQILHKLVAHSTTIKYNFYFFLSFFLFFIHLFI